MSYAELKAKTHYSFLMAASSPEELVERAARLGLAGLAITDRDGVYGMPKAYLRSKEYPDLKLIIGSELSFAPHQGISLPRVTLLARDRAAYGLLCRMITLGRSNAPKGESALPWEKFHHMLQEPAGRGLVAIPNDSIADPLEPESHPHFDDLFYGGLHESFSDRLFIPLARVLDGRDPARTQRALTVSQRYGASIVATNDVHYHTPERRMLHDVLTATRHRTTLSEAGQKLLPNAERHLKSPRQMATLFRDLPDTLTRTLEIAESCRFSPSELRYRYPSEWIPKHHTAQSYLEELTWKGSKLRFPNGISTQFAAQIRHELALIEKLQFADYFLTISEIVQFAKSKQILYQGRGSAANSVVCYCLEITAINPVEMNMLFERFISAERGEPPDIDVDFEHERREEVIQYIYERYGRDRAGMVAVNITYRDKSSVRDVEKALGPEVGERLGVNAHALAERLVEEIKGFPRHLSIHSGGFTLSADPIIEIVPIEPARMEGRTVIQWDKYDLDILGLLKVDILALGMLSAIRKGLALVQDRDPGLSLATVPANDPKTYAMIQQADTVGVFQIESRAQMSMLGRLRPENFYDLVIEVALVRPGPIVGKMVHPYLKRRRGEEPVHIPDPRLEPILGRTLGVPIFQEQVMAMAIELADFSPGEADQLRRAIGAWRSSGSIEKVGIKLKERLMANGLPAPFIDLIFEQIKGFAEYGFPESHAASFALLVYMSSYLKCHYPAEFACALVNSQPLGFYSNYTLIEDARRHGVKSYPVDPNHSEWDCRIENGGIRLGWRVVRGLSEAVAKQIIAEREKRPFESLADFLARSRVRKEVLHQLAIGDAFSAFGLEQREALWNILSHHLSDVDSDLLPSQGQLSLFSRVPSSSTGEQESPSFPKFDEFNAIRADYSAYGLSVRGHPMKSLRAMVKGIPQATHAEIRKLQNGATPWVCGLLIVRQRPPTAKGTVFATMEDETGFLDLILKKEVHQQYAEMLATHSFLKVHGVLQKEGYSVSMLVRKIVPVFVPMAEAKAPNPGFHHREWK